MTIRPSPGLERAWQAASDFAQQIGDRELQPLHMLYGIFVLPRLLASEPTDSIELREECANVERWTRVSHVDHSALRRRIREELGGKRRTKSQSDDSPVRVSRSESLRNAFARAEQSTVQNRSDVVTVFSLCIELLRLEDHLIQKVLGDAVEGLLNCLPELHTARRVLLTGAVSFAISENHNTELVIQTVQAACPVQHSPSTIAERLSVLSELTWEFGTGRAIDDYVQRFLEQLIRGISGAECAAVLLLDRLTNGWLLKAHVSDSAPILSMTCIRRAVEEKLAFIWTRSEDVTRSQQEANLQQGIYAPLVANDHVIGVITIDSSQSGLFGQDDLFLTVAASHQLALAVANYELHTKLQKNAQLLEHLLVNFSPKVRTRLLDRAQQGRLLLGGERSTVSILCSDIRGFTLLTADMNASEVVVLLNDYFSGLVDCILSNDGTVDKFMGDAILAVFGSPDADPHHCHKAVRAAYAMQRSMEDVSKKRAKQGLRTCQVGIGIHTGEVLHGFVGSPERMEYTVIGDTVNRAARFCAGAKAGEILISPEVFQRLWAFLRAEKTTISTKHEGNFQAYLVKGIAASQTQL